MKGHVKTSMFICLLGMLWIGCDLNSVGPGSGSVGHTARHELGSVDSLAASFGKGLRLMTVISKDAAYDGTSSLWQYQYLDTLWAVTLGPPSTYWFHSTLTTVAFDSNSPLAPGGGTITHAWFDSDSGLAIAERNGGSQFRLKYPRHTIMASVGEAAVPHPTTSWWITYRSMDDNTKLLSFTVDANTGAVKIYGSD